MWLDHFPVPSELLPARFVDLVTPVDQSAHRFVDVATHFEHDPHGPHMERLLMQMALLPDGELKRLGDVRVRSDFSVVSESTPVLAERGAQASFAPSIGGNEYVVASWGDNSFFNFYLAEKVWMALGLTARTIGGDHQRVIFDDWRLPEFGIAEGEASNEFHWTSKRPVQWHIRNDYLRRYLWLRGMHGARIFYYNCYLPAHADLVSLLDAQGYFVKVPEDGRYELDLRRDENGILMQIWGVAPVVSPDLCPTVDADDLVWPGYDGPMTTKRARGLQEGDVFVKDTFLERYEQNAVYSCSVFNTGGGWSANPRYRGQWAFTDCVRIGRNAVRIPLRKLYEGLPDREIIHAHAHVMSTVDAADIDAAAPNIVDRTHRLVAGLLTFGDALATLCERVGIDVTAEQLVHLSKERIAADHWEPYPELRRLARVAPADMSQAAFLSRCKSLNELLVRMPQAPVRRLLIHCGSPAAEAKELRIFRMWQGLLNIVTEANARGDTWEDLAGLAAEVNWKAEAGRMSAVFKLNELRNGESHENFGELQAALEGLGFDTALLNAGYGAALDHTFDRVAETLENLAAEIRQVLDA